MDNKLVKQLLTEYSEKRQKAIDLSNQKKQDLLDSNPKLSELENKISQLSIQITKSIINSDSKEKSKLITSLKKDLNSLIKEKNMIIKNLCSSTDFLEPNFECKLCKDTGFVKKSDKSIMCSCLKQKIYDISYNKSNICNLEQENFDKFDQRIFSPKPNKELYKSDLSPRENMLFLKEKAENFINNFDDVNEKNLLFTGNTGLRKNFFN